MSSHSDSGLSNKLMAACEITMHKSAYKIIQYRQEIIHMSVENILTASITLMLKLVSAVNSI